MTRRDDELPASAGSLTILNTGAGDIQITYDKEDEADVLRALTMLQDMQRRGYAILLKVAGEEGWVRADRIDVERREYVYTVERTASAASATVEVSVRMPAPGAAEPEEAEEAAAEPEEPAPRRGGRRGRKASTEEQRAPVGKTHAVGVARSAGG